MPLIRIFEDFDSIPSNYDALFSAAESESPYLSRDWFETLAKATITAGNALRIYAVESSAGEPVAVLPMLAAGGNRRPLTSRHLNPLANYYSPVFAPLLAASQERRMGLQSLARGLMGDCLSWDTIDLHPLAGESEDFPLLVTELRAAGFLVQTYFCFGNWHLRVAGRSFEEYFHSRPAEIKNTLRRKMKRLSSAYRWRTAIVTGGGELDAAVEDYEAVYAASWKVPEPHPDFLRGLMRASAARGWLRLGLLYLDEKPAAAQIWIVANRTATIYKLAYDERYSALSVGSILTAELMRYSIEVDKVTEIDYLTGDDAYKKQWMSHRRERWGILAFNPRTMHGLAAAARHIGGRALKDSALAMRARFAGLRRSTSCKRENV